MEEIIVATKNEGKKREFASILKEYHIVSLNDLDYQDDIIEDGKTFKENAIIKASTIAKIYNKPVISDDSGLEVFSLNNEPGIYSARYAGLMHDDNLNNALLIKNLKDKDNTDCRYVCAIALCYPDGRSIVVEDYCYGKIVLTPRGNGGFGYDPYFYVKEYGKTMAELSLEEKNKISHRGKAIRKLKEALRWKYYL